MCTCLTHVHKKKGLCDVLISLEWPNDNHLMNAKISADCFHPFNCRLLFDHFFKLLFVLQMLVMDPIVLDLELELLGMAHPRGVF